MLDKHENNPKCDFIILVGILNVSIWVYAFGCVLHYGNATYKWNVSSKLLCHDQSKLTLIASMKSVRKQRAWFDMKA